MGVNKPKQIVIHKSARPEVYYDVDVMRKYHMEVRGWSDIGYHFVIKPDGTIQEGRPITRYPASCKGHNEDVVAICCIGEFCTDNPTDEQINSLKTLILRLCVEYKIDTDMHHIFCHADYRDPPGNRYCPGKNLHRRIPEISNWVRDQIRKGV